MFSFLNLRFLPIFLFALLFRCEICEGDTSTTIPETTSSLTTSPPTTAPLTSATSLTTAFSEGTASIDISTSQNMDEMTNETVSETSSTIEPNYTSSTTISEDTSTNKTREETTSTNGTSSSDTESTTTDKKTTQPTKTPMETTMSSQSTASVLTTADDSVKDPVPSSSLSPGAIAAIVLGCLAGAVLIGVVLTRHIQKSKRQKNYEQPGDFDNPVTFHSSSYDNQ